MNTSVVDLLTSQGLVNEVDVEAARLDPSGPDGSIVETLVARGVVSKRDVIRTTVEAAGVEFVDILDVDVDPEAAQLISGDQARKYGALPIQVAGRRKDDELLVVVDSQTVGDWNVKEDLQAITRHRIRFVCGIKSEINTRINQVYRAEAELGSLVRDILDEEPVVDILAPVASTSDAPLVRYVNLLLKQAISDNASDVHVEPTESEIRIRYRIDGVLKEMSPAPKEVQSALMSRLKVMSEMNIAEHRIPQDGRLSVAWHGKKVDLRVSCLPTVWGEKIVMRILDNSAAQLALPSLGFSEASLERWRNAYSRPYGMLVVSGPTGSGKSTTLYATLNTIVRPEINIVTVEDPVEYRIPGINQVQVNRKAGLTFASSLRSILRGDPDVILIGEIRDKETAQIAVESALTGHLVLTTLHTNDAPSVVVRLTEMGVEPYLITSALECASGQRLARRLCDSCKQPAEVPSSHLAHVGFTYPEDLQATFYKPVGCNNCAGTGFRGRIGLHEVLTMTESLAALTNSRASTDELRARALSEGMVTLRQDGWRKVAQGLTTIEEVLRVIV